MTFQEVFIANLKNLRKNRKISQLKLANMCDSTQAYIAEIEVGKKFPSPTMIERIAAALNIESYYLFQSRALTKPKLANTLFLQDNIFFKNYNKKRSV